MYFFIGRFILNLNSSSQYSDKIYHMVLVMINIHNIISYILIVYNYNIYVRFLSLYLSFFSKF